MDALLKNIRKIYPISKESSEQLKGIFKEKKFKKKAPLSFKNHISTKFYIVKSGILRSFITDNNGKEFIKFIYTKHSVVGAFSSLIRKKEKKLRLLLTKWRVNYLKIDLNLNFKDEQVLLNKFVLLKGF